MTKYPSKKLSAEAMDGAQYNELAKYISITSNNVSVYDESIAVPKESYKSINNKISNNNISLQKDVHPVSNVNIDENIHDESANVITKISGRY